MPDITITVDDAHLAAIDEVVAAVRASGVEVTGVHAAIGIISGTVPADRRTALSQIQGVGAIEEAPVFRAAPPDSPIQ